MKKMMPVLFVVLSGCSQGFFSTADVSAPGTIDDAFQEAASTYGVPRDLLVAVAWSTSRLEQEGGLHDHGIAAHGLMGLREGTPDASSGPSLERAARNLGVEPMVLMNDRNLNIQGGAQQLREAADDYTARTGLPVSSLEDWANVVGWYAGIEHDGMQRSFSKAVFALIEQGLDVTLADGERIRISSRPVNIPGHNLQPVSGTSSDYWGTAHFVPAHSSNYTWASRGAADIDTVVIHTAQGSYAGTSSWFSNPSVGASAHYVIRSSDGEVTQMIWEADVAWHAGHSSTNWRSVGIELEGYIEYPGTWYTDEMYASLASVIADICDRNGIPRDRSHIIGHTEVPGCPYSGGGAGCHTDPGSGFDWDYLMSLLNNDSSNNGSSNNGSSTGSTGSLVGYVRDTDLYDSNAGIGGATVMLSTGVSATTSSSGWFEFNAVPTGPVDITVTAPGYSDAEASRDITRGGTSWSSIALVPDATSNPTAAEYSPSGWETVYGPDVTMTWTEVGSRYQVAIYWYSSSGWANYYTYSTNDPFLTFWPTVDDTYYAFSVRSNQNGSWGSWSTPSYFFFNN